MMCYNIFNNKYKEVDKMAEINELKEKLESLEKVKDILSEKKDNKTERVDEMEYFTIAGFIRAAWANADSDNDIHFDDTAHMPFKWVKKSWKYLVSPDFPHGVVSNVLGLLQLVLSVTFLVATAPIWIVDNTVCGSIFLISKASLKGDIKATEKKLAVVEQQINSIETEIKNQTKAVELAKALTNGPKKITKIEAKQTEQSKKSEENIQDK